MNRSQILAKISEERNAQLEKWGRQNHSYAYWNAILTEETGEVAREVCENCYNLENEFHDRPNVSQNLKTELIQVAAVCVAWLEAMEKQDER